MPAVGKKVWLGGRASTVDSSVVRWSSGMGGGQAGDRALGRTSMSWAVQAALATCANAALAAVSTASISVWVYVPPQSFTAWSN